MWEKTFAQTATLSALCTRHFSHVAACLWHKLCSTEEKLFWCLRDSWSTHTLGHNPRRGLIYCCVCVCIQGVFVFDIMRLLDVAVWSSSVVCKNTHKTRGLQSRRSAHNAARRQESQANELWRPKLRLIFFYCTVCLHGKKSHFNDDGLAIIFKPWKNHQL